MTEQQINAIWEEYYPKVFGYFFRRVNNQADVEDLTSITLSGFMLVLVDDNKRQNIKNIHGFLWKIANNQLATFIRNKSKVLITVGLNDNLDSLDENIEDDLSDHYKAKIQDIDKCLQDTIKAEDYQIIRASIIDEMPSKEIAIMFNQTADNIRQRISRGIKKLKATCINLWQLCNHN
jgi:RNA polymerase sigma factor (sigma-70 family)